MARPPVCKIMDYGKYKYQQKRNAAEQKRKQKVIEVKEVKFRPKTGEHDFQTKVRHLREFLAEGDKAKVTIMFRGREIVHPEIGHDVLKRVTEAIQDVAIIELAPRMEGRSMFMVVAPGKPGQTPKPLVVPPVQGQPLAAAQGGTQGAPQTAPGAGPAVAAVAAAGSTDSSPGSVPGSKGEPEKP
jgi:translation initiation factor IF-3